METTNNEEFEIKQNIKNDMVKEEEFKDTDLGDHVVLPTADYEKLQAFIKLLENIDIKTYNAKFTKDDNIVAGVNLDSSKKTIKDNVYSDTVNNNDYVNDIKYGENEFNIRPLAINSKAGSTLKGNAALAKLTQSIGIGVHTQIPLWHSGFWITLRPPKDVDIINLNIKIANNEMKLGRETNTFIYSNYSVVLNNILTEFILDHMVSCSLDYGDRDIKEFIKVQDLYPLVNGLIKAMYPNGYGVSKACVNSLVIEDDKPKCNSIISGTVDPDKMLWVNRKALTKEMIHQMSKKSPKSTTIDEVVEYQNNLFTNNHKQVVVKSSTGMELKLTLKAPNLNEYINNGEEWVNTIIAIVEETVGDDTEKPTEERINKIVLSMVLGIYNIFITQVEYDDGSVVVDRATLNELVNAMSADDELLANTLEEIKKFISDYVIAIVGTPNYVCPNCGEIQKEVTDNRPFRNIIPENILENFFDLSALVARKVESRA